MVGGFEEDFVFKILLQLGERGIRSNRSGNHLAGNGPGLGLERENDGHQRGASTAGEHRGVGFRDPSRRPVFVRG